MQASHVKTWIKKHGSPKTLRFLVGANASLKSFHYWVPYAVMDGRTLAPTHLTLDITYICNLKCEMCPQAIDFESENSDLLGEFRARKELSTEAILRLVEEAANLGVRTFTITGGEAFLRKDLLDIVARVKDRKMMCELLTNGMLIGPSVAERLVALGVDKVTVSVDGPEDIHNKIRKNKHSFRRLMEAIQLIQAEKNRQGSSLPYLALATTITATNQERLSELVEVAGSAKVNVDFGFLYYATAEMEQRTAELLQYQEAKGEDQDIPEHLKRIDPRIVEDQVTQIRRKEPVYAIKANFTPNLSREEIRRRYDDDSYAYANKCFYPWFHVRINPYGDVYPCGPISMKMGNVTEESLRAVWNGRRYRDFRRLLKKQQLFPKCTKCCALNTRLWSHLPRI